MTINITQHQNLIIPFQNNRTQSIANIEKRIELIDREIEARENYIVSFENHTKKIKENISSRQEYIKLLQESKAINEKRISNNEKMIVLLDDTNSKLQAILDRKTTRNKITEPVFNSESEVNSSKVKQGNFIKEQAVKIEDRIKKHNIAIDYAEQKISKLSNANKVKDVIGTSISSSRNEGLSNSYKPEAKYIPEIKPIDVEKSKKSFISNLSLEQQKYAIQSQANSWDSIVSSNIRKLL